MLQTALPRRAAARVPSLSALLLLGLVAGACKSRGEQTAAAPQQSTPQAAAPQAVAHAPAAKADRPWGFEGSDIPVNPRVQFGTLANGLRYAWMSNSEPKERSYLRLHVNVGSFAEDDREQGIAHFLEHMVFNGTKHYPAGTLVEWFQKHGMSFGGDTNAATSFSETVYEINLPKSDAASIEEGLGVLRDFADGALLEQKEIDSEKGVIDAEERERDNAQFRMFKESMAKEYNGTRVPLRLPIGHKEKRDAFTSKDVRGFYEHWYRPDNMTLVVVGDLGELKLDGLIQKSFDGMVRPKSPVPAEPDLGKPKDVPAAYVIRESEVPDASVRIARVRPFEEKPHAWKTVLEELPGDVARTIVNNRFSEMAKKKGSPFLGATCADLRQEAIFSGIKVTEGEELSASAQPANWDKALDRADRELRRALEYGFDDEEVDEVKANMLRSIDEAERREATKPSEAYVAELLHAAEFGAVPTTAAARRAALRPAIEKLNAAACVAALKASWSKGDTIVSVVGNVDLEGNGADKVRAVLEESRTKEVKPRKKEERKPFAYHSDAAKAGKISGRSHDTSLDFEQVDFENGVKLFVKKTDFQQKQILWTAQIGEGFLSLDPAQRPVSMVADFLYSRGGLGAHSTDDLRRLMAGKQAGVRFTVAPDHFSFTGGTTSEDAVTAFELACAYLTDPGWRPDGMEQWTQQIPLIFESMKHQHGGPITQQFVDTLYSGDARHVFPKQAAFEAVNMDSVKNWISPALENAPIGVTVVGDVDVDAVVKAVAQTFGALPKRRAEMRHEERRTEAKLRTGLRESYTIETEVPKTLVDVYFPAMDARDRATARRADLLAEVFSDRLRVAVREKLGASYSPSASAEMSNIYPNDGFFHVALMSEPTHVEQLRDAVLDVADSLSKGGVTDEELERAKKPLLASLRDAQRQNGWWLGNLADGLRDPKELEAMRDLIPFTEKAAAADLAPIAKAYLAKERASIAIVAPAAKK